MAFSEARRQGFSPGTPVSSIPLWVNGSANKIKAQINAIYILSAQLLLYYYHNTDRIERRKSRYFYNLLTALRSVSNTYAQVSRSQSCANHVQHIGRLSRATCRVSRGMKGQFSYEVRQSLKHIYVSFLSLA